MNKEGQANNTVPTATAAATPVVQATTATQAAPAQNAAAAPEEEVKTPEITADSPAEESAEDTPKAPEK